MQSHIINGHYMFGNTFIQPEMPMYYKIPHHNMAPVGRRIPPYPDMINRPIVECPNAYCFGYEDSATKIDTPYENPDETGSTTICDGNCDSCPVFGSINRDPLISNVMNIETSVIKTLKVTLYGTKKEMDKTIEMKVGNRYAVTYITEHGLFTSIGYLELISESVPDTCTRYINTSNHSVASTAYIGMDCSTEGHSDKRKIYIATIRYIKELTEGEEIEVEEPKSVRETLQELLDAIERGELVYCKNNCCNTGSEEATDNTGNSSNTDSDSGNETDQPLEGNETENPSEDTNTTDSSDETTGE